MDTTVDLWTKNFLLTIFVIFDPVAWPEDVTLHENRFDAVGT